MVERDEQFGVESHASISLDRRRPSTRATPDRAPQRAGRLQPSRPDVRSVAVDDIQRVDDTAVPRAMVEFGVDVGSQERQVEVRQLGAVGRFGAAAISTGHERTDRPCGDRRDRADCGEHGEQELTEHRCQHPRTGGSDPGTDERSEWRRTVHGRRSGYREYVADGLARSRGASPDHASPRVAIGWHDAARRHRMPSRRAADCSHQQPARAHRDDVAGCNRMARAARDTVDGHREDTGELGERHRAVGADVEHAVVQFHRRIVDANRRRHGSADGMAARPQRDPAFAGRPDHDSDVHAATRGRCAVLHPGWAVLHPGWAVLHPGWAGHLRGWRFTDGDGASHPQPGGHQTFVRCDWPVIDHQSGGRRQVECPGEVGHRIGRCRGADDEARSVGPARFAGRDRRVVHVDTVGAQVAERERIRPPMSEFPGF